MTRPAGVPFNPARHLRRDSFSWMDDNSMRTALKWCKVDPLGGRRKRVAVAECICPHPACAPCRVYVLHRRVVLPGGAPAFAVAAPGGGWRAVTAAEMAAMTCAAAKRAGLSAAGGVSLRGGGAQFAGDVAGFSQSDLAGYGDWRSTSWMRYFTLKSAEIQLLAARIGSAARAQARR